MLVHTLPLAATVRTPLKMVAVGDSLTAGFQDATLVAEHQEHSYPSQIARQANIPFRQPLIGGRGMPPRVFDQQDLAVGGTVWRYLGVGAATALPAAALALGTVPPEYLLEPVYKAGAMGKTLPEHRTDIQNLAVPNFELRHLTQVSGIPDILAEMTDGRTASSGLMMLAPYVHSILQEEQSSQHGRSQIDRAVEQKPDLVLFWAGANDALDAVNGGIVNDQTLTPMDDKKWTYHTYNPIQGTRQAETPEVVPGFKTSLVGPEGALTRLLNETEAEIAVMNIPDVTVIPYLKTVGEKVGKMPFRIVLPNGTDVTSRLEEWTIPDTISGPGHNGRTVFPPGTRVGLKTMLTRFVQYGCFLEAGRKTAVFGEDDVLTPDEIDQIQQRTREYNQLLEDTARQNPRLHLVDTNGLLTRAMTEGIPLQGSGEPVTVTNACTGLQDERGYSGFFSYDGMHPSNVGHAVVANAVLDKLRADLTGNPKFLDLVQAPPIDEREVLRQDVRSQGTETLTFDAEQNPLP